MLWPQGRTTSGARVREPSTNQTNRTDLLNDKSNRRCRARRVQEASGSERRARVALRADDPKPTWERLRPTLPPRLSFDLFEVGVGGEGAEPTSFGRERVPGGAAGVHDGLVIGEQPVREVALPQIQPDALDRVEVR